MPQKPPIDPGRPAPNVLTERIAASLLEHDPGWRLPRRSDLARRFNATVVEVDAAISQLASRCLVRELDNGHVYITSPAEYLITLDQLPFLGSHIDPMGTPLKCASHHALRRAVPAEVAKALRLDPVVCVPVALTIAILHPGHFRISVEVPKERICPLPTLSE